MPTWQRDSWGAHTTLGGFEVQGTRLWKVLLLQQSRAGRKRRAFLASRCLPARSASVSRAGRCSQWWQPARPAGGASGRFRLVLPSSPRADSIRSPPPAWSRGQAGRARDCIIPHRLLQGQREQVERASERAWSRSALDPGGDCSDAAERHGGPAPLNNGIRSPSPSPAAAAQAMPHRC